MDTISRENNSMLPVAGVVVGVIGLLLGGIALVQLSKVKQTVSEHDAKVATIDGIKATADGAAATADKAKADLAALSRSTQDAFNQVGPALTGLREDVTKIQESLKKPAPAPAGKGGGPVVAGPGEYVVKAGDTGAKIARAQGVALNDLVAVNSGVNFNKLHVGQKIKLPAKGK
ncbi:MAG: LysM peptidoglycan-binding domain-containing protein [Verrucomicrobia bacterium]|nr:LysM peptidoglycan-binding domain-containing protein [Verrucomicrobiota bacterium]